MFTLILFSLNSVLKMFQMWYAPFYYTCYCHKGNLSFVFHRIQTVAYQAAPTRLLLPWEFPGKNTGVGCHFLLQRNLPNPGIKPGSPALQADTLPSELPEKFSSHLGSPRINIDQCNWWYLLGNRLGEGTLKKSVISE